MLFHFLPDPAKAALVWCQDLFNLQICQMHLVVVAVSDLFFLFAFYRFYKVKRATTVAQNGAYLDIVDIFLLCCKHHQAGAFLCACAAHSQEFSFCLQEACEELEMICYESSAEACIAENCWDTLHSFAVAGNFEMPEKPHGNTRRVLLCAADLAPSAVSSRGLKLSGC